MPPREEEKWSEFLFGTEFYQILSNWYKVFSMFEKKECKLTKYLSFIIRGWGIMVWLNFNYANFKMSAVVTGPFIQSYHFFLKRKLKTKTVPK